MLFRYELLRGPFPFGERRFPQQTPPLSGLPCNCRSSVPQRTRTDEGSSMIGTVIHLAKRAERFRQTEPLCSHCAPAIGTTYYGARQMPECTSEMPPMTLQEAAYEVSSGNQDCISSRPDSGLEHAVPASGNTKRRCRQKTHTSQPTRSKARKQ